MSRHPVVFLLCFLVLLLARPPALQCRQLVIDSDAQFRFALTHMEKHRYDLAVVELERFIYFFPEDRRIPRAHYLVGACYVAQKKYETARKVLAHVHETFPGTEAGGRALLLMGVSYERQGALGEAERCFSRVLREYPRAPLKDAARYRLGWTRMKAGRWKEASDTFREIPPESGLHAGAGILSEKSLEGESLPLKDPAAAGVMAGILPGMGHAYCGRPRDGLVALLVNGLFTWAAAVTSAPTTRSLSWIPRTLMHGPHTHILPPSSRKSASSFFIGGSPPAAGTVSARPVLANCTALLCKTMVASISIDRAALASTKGNAALSGFSGPTVVM